VRISEIANAEEQVGLLKIIMDKTWEAIAAQQRQQAAQAQQKATPKPKPVKARSPKVPYAPPPPKLAKPRVNPQVKQPTPVAQQVKPQAKVATLNKSIQAPQKASNDSKDGFLQQIRSEIKNGLNGEDRHSKNNFPTSS
jgi:outer membrane biosynthesis protein TonB